jgi:hypothetical protein
MNWEYKYNIDDVVDVFSNNNDTHYYNRSGIIIQRVFNLDKTEAIYVVRVDGDDDFFPPKTFYEEELKHSISHIRNKKLEELGI